MKKAKLKLNKNFSARNLKKGTSILIDVDNNNIPLDLYWRRRLKDSKIDNCVEIAENKISKNSELQIDSTDKVINQPKKNK